MPSGHIAKGNFERPLSAHAWACLAEAASDPQPSQETNFGVCDKLVRMGYAIYEDRPSPYRSHKPGHTVSFLVATEWGKFALEEHRAGVQALEQIRRTA